MSDASAGNKTAENLWARAHEHVRRGDFANAVRDLAQCYQLLQSLNDPRVYEVHKRWTEVHRMYMEDGQRQPAPVENKAPSVEAEAEAAANAGDLDRAVALYRQALAQSPGNELISERVHELLEAKKRADDLVRGTAPPVAAAPAVAEADDWSDVGAAVGSTPADQPAVDARITAAQAVTAAPTMAVEDAPVGMQSLDVPFSVGEPIDSFAADALPVTGPGAAHAGDAGDAGGVDDVEGQIAFLEELSARVRENRRALAS